MRSLHVTAAAAIAALGMMMPGEASPAAQAQQTPRYSSSTHLVTVAVSVMKNGQPVTGLTQADFEVRSDGRPVPIVQFTNEPGPVTAGVLVDASGSMAVNRAMEPALLTARELLAELTPGVDRAGVFTFDRTLQMAHEVAPAGPSQLLALDRVEAFGSTSIHDAVLGTSRALAASSSPRRAVVLLTDGIDTSSTQAPDDVRALVAEIDVPVYVVVFGAPASAALEALARDTGGQVLAMGVDAPAQRTRATIVSTLRQHYLLAFAPDVRPGWHSLSVRTRQNHTVRARAGYAVSSRITH